MSNRREYAGTGDCSEREVVEEVFAYLLARSHHNGEGPRWELWAGIDPRIASHDLRRWFVITLLDTGVDVSRVYRLVGHAPCPEHASTRPAQARELGCHRCAARGVDVRRTERAGDGEPRCRRESGATSWNHLSICLGELTCVLRGAAFGRLGEPIRDDGTTRDASSTLKNYPKKGITMRDRQFHIRISKHHSASLRGLRGSG